MALNKTALKAGIKALHENMMSRSTDSYEEYAQGLADLIDAFVKSGKVRPGITVATTGTAAAHTGQTTSEGEIF
ncbi:MAG: hypothetical protein EAY75_15035 [Bacteroidetes bacterium]|nr:MAG: hypothetical protein EAY75_15035 [Bacteroidota bacterium]